MPGQRKISATDRLGVPPPRRACASRLRSSSRGRFMPHLSSEGGRWGRALPGPSSRLETTLEVQHSAITRGLVGHKVGCNFGVRIWYNTRCEGIFRDMNSVGIRYARLCDVPLAFMSKEQRAKFDEFFDVFVDWPCRNGENIPFGIDVRRFPPARLDPECAGRYRADFLSGEIIFGCSDFDGAIIS